MSRNRVIGRNGSLPWKLPADLQFFKKTTTGKSIIMGRRTYESIGRPLPHRTNIVLSRKNFSLPGVHSASSLKEAIGLVETLHPNHSECFVIGGAEAYAQSLPIADKLFCTFVDADIVGDTIFPEIDFKKWILVSEEFFPQDESHQYPFIIRGYRSN